MTRTALVIAAAAWACAASVEAQPATRSAPRPLGRVSLFSTLSRTTSLDRDAWNEGALSLSFTLHQIEDEDRPSEYGLDLRYATFSMGARPARTSVYEAFAGVRLSNGSIGVRGGHMWLNDLGALGSIAGGLVEYRQPRERQEGGRLRIGAFGGLEPNILETGYAPDVMKVGAYATYEGERARRNTLGYVLVRNAGLTERSVLTTTNYVPAGDRFFVYQAAELDASRPAGRGARGLAYLFTSARWVTVDRLDLHGIYQRGRSIDARGLVESLVSGRPLSPQALNGLLFESAGGRVTFNAPATIAGSPLIYAGYYKDRHDEAAPVVSRTTLGVQLTNVARRGVDIAASDTRRGDPSGTYHSRYVSVGAQVGERVYASGDYSTSLSIVRFTRSSGVIVETRPRTVRWSGSVTGNLTGTLGLLVVAEHTADDTYKDVRVLSGLTYRLR